MTKLKELLEGIEEPSERVLRVLQRSKEPLNKIDLTRKARIRLSALKACLRELQEEGYDIRSIVRNGLDCYYLNRYALEKDEEFYRVHGKIKLPIIITGDWHIGSKVWSYQAYRQLLKDIERYRVKTLIILGDLLQGLGVYRKEAMDLAIHSIQEQVNYASELLDRIEIPIHVCIGSHELALKGLHEVGYDALDHLARLVPNIVYHGEQIKATFGKKYSFLGIHGSGGLTYAASYPLQRSWERLVEKPNIYAMGHRHRFFAFLVPPFNLLMEVGCLSRETLYVLARGITSLISWWVLREFDARKGIIELTCRAPKVY